MSNTLSPAVTINPPKVAVVPDVPSVVTDKEANEAAKALGMTFFSAAKSAALKKIGMFRAQQGVIHLGVGRLAACEDALQKLMDIAVDIADNDTEDTEKRVGALIAGKGLAEAIQKGIQMEAEFQQEKLISGPGVSRKRSFDTDQPIIPINAETVNIRVDDKSSPVDSSKG